MTERYRELAAMVGILASDPRDCTYKDIASDADALIAEQRRHEAGENS